MLASVGARVGAETTPFNSTVVLWLQNRNNTIALQNHSLPASSRAQLNPIDELQILLSVDLQVSVEIRAELPLGLSWYRPRRRRKTVHAQRIPRLKVVNWAVIRLGGVISLCTCGYSSPVVGWPLLSLATTW